MLDFVAELQRHAQPRSKVKLSVEPAFLPEVDAWFLLNQAGAIACDTADEGAGIGGDLQGSFAPAPSFWMHLSQEYFLVAEKANDILLNDFMVKWWKIPGDLTTDGATGQAILRCGAREELSASVKVEASASKYMLRVGAEPHVLERMVCANVGGKKYPVLLEFCAHRMNARPGLVSAVGVAKWRGLCSVHQRCTNSAPDSSPTASQLLRITLATA